MRIDILTLFPKICEGALAESIMKRAQDKRIVSIATHNIRDWARDKHHVTDDTPYGGGQGMVMKPEPIFEAVEEIRNAEVGMRNERGSYPQSAIRNPQSKIVLMSPAGRRLDQKIAAAYAQESHVIVVCGHYEGVDQRVVDHLIDDEISIGDYVLTNGAIAAIVFVDAIVRLIPGVLGDEGSAADDSFAQGLLEFPSTRAPSNTAAGAFRMFCYRETTPPSRNGARSNRSKRRSATGRICCAAKCRNSGSWGGMW